MIGLEKLGMSEEVVEVERFDICYLQVLHFLPQ